MKARRQTKSRLNIRVPSDLMKWIKKFAKDRNTTVTQIVILHFMNTKSGEQLRVDHDPFFAIDKNFKKEAAHG